MRNPFPVLLFTQLLFTFRISTEDTVCKMLMTFADINKTLIGSLSEE